MNAWKITLRKTLRAALGLLVCSIGSYCTIVADVGLAPWDALFMGVSEHLPVSYGTVSVTCGLIVVVVDLLMHEKIGVGMLLDAFMVGKVIDLLRYLDVLAQPTSYAMRVGLMILGITILCCGLPIYMGAGLCCGPRDALLVGLGKRVRKIPIGVVNMIMFAVVVLVTLMLRGPIGIGTLLAVALQGPIMQLVFHITHFEPRDVEQESLIETFRKLFPVPIPPPRRTSPAIPDKSTKNPRIADRYADFLFSRSRKVSQSSRLKSREKDPIRFSRKECVFACAAHKNARFGVKPHKKGCALFVN